jgi:pimeloyl-ACP methyl ester carboxylesterase
MEFITWGSDKNPTMLLIHPSKCNGHCFELLYPYLQGFYLICPTLNGHNVNDHSVYENYQKETDAITAYIKEQKIHTLHTVLGLSLGTLEAYEIYRRKEFVINHLVLDGAPFHHMNRLAKYFMMKSQFVIRNKCRKNLNGKYPVDIMYPQFAPMMKEITAHYDDDTLVNMVRDIGGISLDKCIDNNQVTFLYGEKDPYRKTILDVQKSGYRCRTIIQQGCGHVQYILRNHQEYADLLIGRK